MKHVWLAAFLLMNAVLGVAQSSVGTSGATAPEGVEVRSAPPPLEPEAMGEPHTEMLDPATSAGHDPLLEPRPLPRADLSLVGGIARKVDMVHGRVMVQPFGGGSSYLIYYDARTRILSGGRETTALAIHRGDRIYADTQVLGAQVFARTIQVRATGSPAQASGQVLDIVGPEVRLLDRLSGQTVRFAISGRTKVESGSRPATAGDLRAGSLIDVTFTPGGRSEAQSVTIHASPGESYIFAGILTYVDLRDGELAVDNQVDGNNYELSFDPRSEKNLGQLVVGTPISVSASFDGKGYKASEIKITENVERSDR